MTANETIGITGGIGAGKSVVSRILRCNGYIVYDCDSEAKYLMVHDSNLKRRLKGALGEKVYLEDGNLNKDFLSEKVFNDFKVRNFVNETVHEAVRQDIRKERDKINGLFFIESAIIATGGLSTFCDEIWIVSAPLDIRLERVIKRDATDVEKVRQRIKIQEEEIKKLRNSKLIVIENNNKNPILGFILREIENYKLNQTYIYHVKEDIGHNR